MSPDAMKFAWLCGILVTGAIGALMIRDGQRLEKHIRIAQGLIASGMDELEAMEQSGCNHWERPFVLRFWRKYPSFPN